MNLFNVFQKRCWWMPNWFEVWICQYYTKIFLVSFNSIIQMVFVELYFDFAFCSLQFVWFILAIYFQRKMQIHERYLRWISEYLKWIIFIPKLCQNVSKKHEKWSSKYKLKICWKDSWILFFLCKVWKDKWCFSK